jgi:outer membrane receptor protein involved in Fe transport
MNHKQTLPLLLYRFSKIFGVMLCLIASCVSAQDIDESSVERIVVSADLSNRSLSELPGSNLVLSAGDIEFREARHLQDIAALMPNVNFTAGSSRGKFVQIRGIGERSQFSEPINPSIGLFIDDIDISGLGSLATLFDLQQVEILSGPQSVAVGTNSLGGVIKLVSHEPAGSPQGKLSASLGQSGAMQIGGAYSNAISSSLSARISAQTTQEDGFVYNAFLDADDVNNIDETTATLFLQNTFNERQQLGLNVYYFDIDNGYDAFSLDNDNVTQSDEPGFDKTEALAASAKYQHSFDNMNAELILTHLDADFDYGYDEDWTFPAFHPFTYSSFDRYVREVERQSINARLRAKEGNAKDWLIGLSYSDSEEFLLREYTFASADFNSEYRPSSAALYGQYVFALNSDTNLTLASRLERFNADYQDSAGFVENLDDTLVAASISIDTNWQDVLWYSSLSRGYKAGGFNFDQRLSSNDRIFKPEFNWNIEAGVKGKVGDTLGRYQVTVFYMRREDAQLSDFATFENELEDGSVVTSFADAIRNTDTGLNKGIEITSQWQVSEVWKVDANLGYLDARFGNYTRIDGSFVPEQDQAQAPDFTLYIASQYQLGEHWLFSLDADAKDSYRFSDGHEERAPFTLVMNTSLSWQKAEHLVRLWVKNLADRKVFTRGFGGFSNDPRDEYAFDEPYFQFGQERQVGITYEYQF